jgi:glutathione S-transferase
MIRVLGIHASSNVQKVTWLLAELGEPFEREDYGGKTGRNIKAPPYLDLNPNGTIPTLIDGEFVLWESNSICRYLARKYSGSRLYPGGLQERPLCERWMDWQLGTLRPSFQPLFRILITTPPEQRDPAAVARLEEAAARAFRIMELTLERSEYLGGATFSLADIATAVWAHRWFALRLDRGRMPKLAAWYRALCARPAFIEQVVSAPFE